MIIRVIIISIIPKGTHIFTYMHISFSIRCSDCGCPGCLSVYNSITTNIFAAEERIMGKVETRMQQLMEHIDSRFDALYGSLLSRQDELVRVPTEGHTTNPTQRHHGQRNGRKPGDTSVWPLIKVWDMIGRWALIGIITEHVCISIAE